jgi:hypothetical protein
VFEERSGEMAGDVEAWEGFFEVESVEDEKENPVGLAHAIVRATEKADVGTTYDVSRIQVTVGNPGPTSYKVVITKAGTG